MVSAVSARLTDISDDWADALLADPGTYSHRGTMAVVRNLVAAHVNPLSRHHGSTHVLRRALGYANNLADLQGPDGLFSSGGNASSPPDSCFTLNDLALTRRIAGDAAPQVLRRLDAVARTALPAVVSGGVHTPNHRWEVAAALAALADLHPQARTRAEQWLAEGVDVDADGVYSERSPNYAAHVSNHCLLVMADALGHGGLADVVHRNLHVQLDLTDADGIVESVQSRRQDQNAEIPLTLFHAQLRRFAVAGCPRCLSGTQRSEPTDAPAALDALAEMLADPSLAVDLPPGREPTSVRRHLQLGLTVRQDDRVRTVIYGGSDVPEHGTVGSGLAANPTFLRFRNGDAVVRSARLSRGFFGLGPFRADSMGVAGDVVQLDEMMRAYYYQPLAADARRRDGAYELATEGRYSSAMSFRRRHKDELPLGTGIRCSLASDGVALDIDVEGTPTDVALELALGEGTLTGAEQVEPDVWRLSGYEAVLRNGDDTVVITTDLPPRHDVVGRYLPGEVYTFLGGTDALGGPRLYLSATAPVRFRVGLSAGA